MLKKDKAILEMLTKNMAKSILLKKQMTQKY